MAPSVIVRRLCFRYIETGPPVFHDLTLEIPGGACCAILGPTASGKTTLLQVLSGIVGSQVRTATASGSVTIGSETFDPIPGHVLFPFAGLVLQEPSLQLSGIKETVRDEIAFTLDNLNIPPGEQHQRIERILSVFRISHLADRPCHQLSGGELQRIALASILVAGPSLLLLDEPAGALDSRSQQIVKSVIRELKGRTTVILTDTTIEFALAVADRLLVLDKGAVVFSGPRDAFLRDLDRFSRLLPVEYWIDLRNAPGPPPPRLRPLLGIA